MLEGVEISAGEGGGGLTLELVLEGFDGVLVAGDDEVDVGGEDAAGADDDVGAGHGGVEAGGDGLDLWVGEEDGFVVEGLFGGLARLLIVRAMCRRIGAL